MFQNSSVSSNSSGSRTWFQYDIQGQWNERHNFSEPSTQHISLHQDTLVWLLPPPSLCPKSDIYSTSPIIYATFCRSIKRIKMKRLDCPTSYHCSKMNQMTTINVCNLLQNCVTADSTSDDKGLKLC